jgi:hypothetical protein
LILEYYDGIDLFSSCSFVIKSQCNNDLGKKINYFALIPKRPNVRTAGKPVLGGIT